MKVKVDETLCAGHGRCYTLAPEVYSADEDGWCAERGEPFLIDPAKVNQGRLGAESCPENAISLTDDS
jgi:ferredoxin